MNKYIYRLTILTVTVVTHTPGEVASAQGTAADYARAAAYTDQFSNKVFRDRVSPNWFGDGRYFWYRVETAPGAHEFVLVDAEGGSRREAFDHADLARRLDRLTDEKVSRDSLPLSGLTFENDLSAVTFGVFGGRWRYGLEDTKLERLEDEPAGEAKFGKHVTFLPAVEPSRRADQRTTLKIHNNSNGSFEIFWVDDRGKEKTYGRVAAGEDFSIRTFENHAWVLRAPDRVVALRVNEEWPVVVIKDRGQHAEADRPTELAEQANEDNTLSPDGKWRVFARGYDLFVRPADASGGETRLTTDGESDDSYYEENVSWSPDSKKFFAYRLSKGLAREISIVESSPADQVLPKLHTYRHTKPGDEMPQRTVCLFDIEKMEATEIPSKLFAQQWKLDNFRWYPDSSAFTFRYNERGHQRLRVIEVDADRARPRVLIDEVSPTFISYKRKFFLHFDDDDREIVWMSERDGWNHLYLIDGRRGKVKNRITRGKWVVRNVEHVDKERREIWFSASGLIPGQDPYYLHLCRVNFDGSGMTVLTDGDGTHEWAFSPDRRYFVDSWSRVDEPPVTVLRDARTGKVVCRLERADASRLFATGWIAPEPLAAKGRDGETDIHGIIVRPSNFSTEKTYPVVEYIYAGPHSAFVPKAFGMNRILHEMAELGFVVVQIDGMGTSWRSKAFHDVCWGNLSDGGFPDRVRWIRAAAENVPQMDLSRVGIHGGSAGGQNAMSALLSFPDFYHVGVADCGCHDNRVDKAWWNELYMGYPVGPQYAKNSNVERAHLLKGKLFLIVGELDKNVDPSSTLQVVDALIKADKDFDLLVMPGVGHAAARTEYGRRRLMDFMVRNLHGVEPRRDAGKVPSSLAEADPVTVPSEP